MCRLLTVKSDKPFKINCHLRQFAAIARNSREFQGDGWGFAKLLDGEWKVYKSLAPVWEDDLEQFGSASLLIAHTRSAFRNSGIRIENNMPFFDGHYAFIFNGELRQVRIKEDGGIGAEKIFNTIKRFDRGNLLEALEKTRKIIIRRSGFIRAMNTIIADSQKICYSSLFNEDRDYFTMHIKKSNGILLICSEPYPDDADDWEKINNGTIGEI